MCLDLPELERRTLAHGEIDGFEYQIVHNDMGVRCAYVRVPQGHPWFGKDRRELEGQVPVRGTGVNFAEHGTACETHGPEAEWWLGWDYFVGGWAPDPELVKLSDPQMPEREWTKRFAIDMQRINVGEKWYTHQDAIDDVTAAAHEALLLTLPIVDTMEDKVVYGDRTYDVKVEVREHPDGTKESFIPMTEARRLNSRVLGDAFEALKKQRE